MRTVNITLLISCLTLISACDPLPKDAYINHGDPEGLLTESTEIVTFDLDTRTSLDALSDKLVQDKPTRAVLNCSSSEKTCRKAKGILTMFDIPTKVSSDGNDVSLMYDRALTGSCENSYTDNSINHYNLNHPAYGCSMRNNTVQMVRDKKQFTDPSELEPMDGEKAAQNMDHYLNPPASTSSSGMSSSLVNSAISQ